MASSSRRFRRFVLFPLSLPLRVVVSVKLRVAGGKEPRRARRPAPPRARSGLRTCLRDGAAPSALSRLELCRIFHSRDPLAQLLHFMQVKEQPCGSSMSYSCVCFLSFISLVECSMISVEISSDKSCIQCGDISLVLHLNIG